jgi:hypothetical protein
MTTTHIITLTDSLSAPALAFTLLIAFMLAAIAAASCGRDW